MRLAEVLCENYSTQPVEEVSPRPRSMTPCVRLSISSPGASLRQLGYSKNGLAAQVPAANDGVELNDR